MLSGREDGMACAELYLEQMGRDIVRGIYCLLYAIHQISPPFERS